MDKQENGGESRSAGWRNIKGLEFLNLVFADQISRNNAPTTLEVPSFVNTFYFDISSGLLLYTKSYWFGVSAQHLTTPNQSLLGGESYLPLKYSFHTGINLPVGSGAFKKRKTESTNFISPALNYRGQEKFDQLDIGFYYTYSPLVLGIWCRGIPIMKSYEPKYINHDAIAFILGPEVNDF